MAYALWERTTLETFLKDHWSLTPIKWENSPFVVPSQNGSHSPYLAFVLRAGTGQVVSLGSRLLTRHATLAITQVFVPESIGKKVQLEYVDLLLDLWIPQDFTDGTNVLRTRPAYFMPQGVDRGWYEAQVIVPYVLDVPVPNYLTV